MTDASSGQVQPHLGFLMVNGNQGWAIWSLRTVQTGYPDRPVSGRQLGGFWPSGTVFGAYADHQ